MTIGSLRGEEKRCYSPIAHAVYVGHASVRPMLLKLSYMSYKRMIRNLNFKPLQLQFMLYIYITTWTI